MPLLTMLLFFLFLGVLYCLTWGTAGYVVFRALGGRDRHKWLGAAGVGFLVAGMHFAWRRGLRHLGSFGATDAEQKIWESIFDRQDIVVSGLIFLTVMLGFALADVVLGRRFRARQRTDG